MNVFELRDRLIEGYGSYVRSFIAIRDERIAAHVDRELEGGYLWPNPLTQLNPNFEPGETLRELVDEGLLHEECLRIFRKKPAPTSDDGPPRRASSRIPGRFRATAIPSTGRRPKAGSGGCSTSS